MVRKLLPLLLLLACAAEASIITQAAWYPAPGLFGDTDWPNTTTNYANLSFNKFDSSLGSLTRVTLTWEGWVNSEYTVTNISEGPYATEATISQYDAYIRMRILKPGEDPVFTLSNPYLSQVSPLLVSVPEGTVLAPGESIEGSVEGSYAKSTTNMSSANRAAFIGPGTIILPLYTATRTVADYTGGNVYMEQTTEALAKLTVTYEYEPAPEPGTVLLLSSGLALLALWRRRAKATP